jgi:hypothetical protein
MATLLLSGIGTLVGGPIGGALGALVGQQVDQAVIGSKTRQGPRLKDLAVQASSYGAAIPRLYGRMRVAGSVIWASDLEEHREKQGGGKGRPKTVSYTYSSSFAVALSSRPILGVGRIWADGSLLRGADGDLKVPGTLRLHTGHGDQMPDPLLAAAEGDDRCPAYRGCAYAVFEDLQLADFGNRIPSLSFEVFADDGEVALSAILADVASRAIVSQLPSSVVGFSIDGGSAGDLIEVIGAAVPLSCMTQGEDLLIASAEPASTAPLLLLEPVPGKGESDASVTSGFTRRREALPPVRLAAIRYYDTERDYQPSVQRGRGRALPGQAATIEFPAAMAAASARALADSASQRAGRAVERSSYRVAELDPALSPGAIVRLRGSTRPWRIDGWEWTTTGIELELQALATRAGTDGADVIRADPGRASNAADLASARTELAALELPWDGNAGGSGPALFAAVSGSSASWRGAALFARHPDGNLVPLGSSGRLRAVLGRALTRLASGSPLVVDRARSVDVQLAASDLALPDAALSSLALGANRALLGEEIIQFGSAEPLGGGRWRLADLLRGRGGTERAIGGHEVCERFVLLDDALIPLDPDLVGDVAHTQLAAAGIADSAPVLASFALAGATLRPLSPVHGRLTAAADGGLALAWTRRARGAWLWPDGVDAPLGEQAEAYLVTLGDLAAPLAAWETSGPALLLSSKALAALRPSAIGATFAVRQRGSRALSAPLTLGILN